MINGKRVAVVMPAYNAENTLEATVREIPDLVDIRILVDDYSKDKTVGAGPEAGAERVRARPELWLRRQPADLLSRSAGRRRRRRGHGPPRLPVHAAADHRHGQHGGLRCLRRGAGVAHHRRAGAARRHAAVQVHFQPLPDRVREPVPGRQAFRVSHRLPRLQQQGADRPCRCWRTRRTSSSTTRCWRSACTSASASARCRAPPSISKRRRPSISAAA